MTVRIQIHATHELPGALARTIHRWQRQNFPAHGGGFVWARPQWHVTVWQGEEPVSYVGVLQRQGTVSGEPVTFGGIGWVVTPLEHRGRGYASLALARAADFMRDPVGAEFGLLITGESLIPFYGRLGWRRVSNPLLVEQPGRGRVRLEYVTMVLPLGGRPWPEGEIDLRGLPW